MLATRFIRRCALISIFAALAFDGAPAQTVKLHASKAPQAQTPPPAPPAAAAPAPGQRIHPARRRPRPGTAPKAADNKTAN
jgi:hypothetical protein